MDWIGRWWQQPDHYRWLSGFLASNGMLPFTRRLLATVNVALGVAPAASLLSPAGPQHPLGRTVSVIVTVVCLLMAALWLSGWPRRWQSITFTVISALAIAAACLAQSDPSFALVGCAAFAALAGYVAFFHTSLYLVMVLVVACVTAGFSAVHLSEAADPAIAAVGLLVVGAGVLAVPLAGQMLVHMLMVDALHSDTDSLTRLRNRRGLDRATPLLMEWRRLNGFSHFAVIMADIDDFKSINDNHGHAAGDQVLIAIGDALRDCVGDFAVAARVGGEEFVVAQLSHVDDAMPTAETLCRTIAALPGEVTASVGIAGAFLDESVDDASMHRIMGRLIDAADTSMYQAKRAGGNRIARGTARLR